MKIIGHRGAKGLAPENTLEALAKGVEHGVDELEIDVRVTRDYIPILSHDSMLDIDTDRLKIITATYAELKAGRPDLTTLAEALDYAAGKSSVYVEVKAGEPIDPIVDVLKKYLRDGTCVASDLVLASRSQSTLLDLHRAMPEIEKVVIEIWSSLRAHFRAKTVGAKRISMLENWLWPGFIQAMKRRGYELYCFPPTNDKKKRRFARLGLSGCTENPQKARKWAEAGLAGVITDYPNLFRK